MTDELRCALAVANVTRNTRESGDDYPSQFGSLKPRALADSLVTLADEVTRLRAEVKEYRAAGEEMSEAITYCCYDLRDNVMYDGGRMSKALDGLRDALRGKEDDND